MNTLDTTAFIGKFVEEARDRLKALTAAVLRLEEVPGAQDAMADVLRQGHNLKGSARMLGSSTSRRSSTTSKRCSWRRRRSTAARRPAFDVLSTIDALSVRVEQLARGSATPPTSRRCALTPLSGSKPRRSTSHPPMLSLGCK